MFDLRRSETDVRIIYKKFFVGVLFLHRGVFLCGNAAKLRLILETLGLGGEAWKIELLDHATYLVDKAGGAGTVGYAMPSFTSLLVDY